MYIHDSHVHTKYSVDGRKDVNGELSTIIETAIARGVDEISLCDHCDIDCILDGLYPEYPEKAIREDIFSAKEKYKGKIRINYGIELGQAHAREREARELLSRCGFDLVIGSLHNLRAYPDFYYLKYDRMCHEMLDYLMKRTVSELCEIAQFEGISTIAHITYMKRYLTACGVKFDLAPYYDGFARFFSLIKQKGIALEVNTSGLRRGDVTMPDLDLCRLYRECGGELVTIGSDAHSAADIACGIEETAAVLRGIGIKAQAVVRENKLTAIEL